MKKILFIALLLSTGISGQESKIDSLENEIKNIDEQIKSLN
jgi:peptidoglycan hydrolase CwlO-like protein